MKRRILSMIVALMAIAGGVTAQTLSVQPVEAQTGEQTEMVVSLTGGTSLTALQFNLALPEGVAVNTNSTTLGAATNGHTLSVQTLSGGNLLFILYSMNLNRFKDGELLRIPVTAGSEAVTTTGRLYTVRTATAEAVSQACGDATFSVTVSEPQPEPRPNVSGKTFTLNCARGYLYGDGTKIAGTADAAQASKFAIVTYNGQTYLYDATNKAFAVHTTAAQAGNTGNNTLESRDDFSKAVTGLTWGETGYESYPFYLEDSFGNWLNMDGAKRVYMNTWKDFEGGVAGNTYAVTIVDTEFDAAEAIAMLDAYFNPAATVTYVISDENGVVFTSEPQPTKPGTVITELPEDMKRTYCSYDVTRTTMTAGTNKVDVMVSYSLPFKVNTSFADAVWYYATIRGTKYLRADETNKDSQGRYTTSATNERTAAYRWAFFGNPYTYFYIANEGAGEGKYLCAADAPVMQTVENPTETATALWAVSTNGDGVSLRSITGTNLYINDNSGAGNLGYWNDAAAATDAGSRWNIEEVPADGIREMKNEELIMSNETGATYDLVGRRIQRITRPGLYIAGRRKVLVK